MAQGCEVVVANFYYGSVTCDEVATIVVTVDGIERHVCEEHGEIILGRKNAR